MKRTVLWLTVAMLLISLLAGCAGTPVVVDKTSETEPEAAPAQDALKLGLAIAPSVGGSKAASAEGNGKADYDVTVVGVLVDDGGVIRDCIIDSVGTSVSFDGAGQIVDFDSQKQIPTKNELGDNYGMKAYAGSKYEWNEQAAALAKFAVGKTAEELRAGAVNEAGKAKDADLASVATIYIGSYVGAIEKAVANAQHLGTDAGDVLKMTVNNAVATASAGEKEGSVELTVDVAALSMKGETITGCLIDSLQAKVSFDTAGALTTDVSVVPQTKNEQGENYGMKAWGNATYEWNEQAANFAAYITGKTAADVAGIAVAESTKPADGTDLAASVTIAIGGFQALIAKAAQ